jgi:hypothetical protein
MAQSQKEKEEAEARADAAGPQTLQVTMREATPLMGVLSSPWQPEPVVVKIDTIQKKNGALTAVVKSEPASE